MHFEDLMLSKVIFELRYDEGYLYWDKCGVTLLDIKRNFPEWKWEGISTELARLKDNTRNMELVFNYENIRFIQNEVENLNQLKETTGKITPLIVKNFEINKFKRVGNRYQYVFPLENPEQGKKIIRKSSLMVIPEEKLSLFGENSTKSNFVVYIENENYRYRIELVGIERVEVSKNIKINEQFNPKYGLRVDVDIATVNKVDTLDFDCGNFIQSNTKFLENNLTKFI